MSGDHSSARDSTPWDQIKEQLKRKLITESFENWISRTKFSSIEGKTLVVSAPDRATVEFLTEEYSQQVTALAVALRLGIERVEFISERASRMPGLPGTSNDFQQNDSQSDVESPLSLNPRFTFESFVVGSCNQFAHAAARAVASVTVTVLHLPEYTCVRCWLRASWRSCSSSSAEQKQR